MWFAVLMIFVAVIFLAITIVAIEYYCRKQEDTCDQRKRIIDPCPFEKHCNCKKNDIH